MDPLAKNGKIVDQNDHYAREKTLLMEEKYAAEKLPPTLIKPG